MEPGTVSMYWMPDRAQPGREVVAGHVLVGAGGAVRGDDAVHDLGVDRSDAVVVHLEFEECFLPVIGQEHVGVFDHLVDDLLPGLVLEVDGDGPLAPVVEKEAGVHLRAAESTRLVARERLHLDHVGAAVSHHRGGRRDRHDVSHFHDLNSLEYSRHAYLHIKTMG